MTGVPWWQGFFDADYLRLWGSAFTPERTAAEVDGLWALARLAEGSRVLDAPCGQGRIARALAARGARVLGVDQSAALLAQAERDRGELAPERLRYRRHDLREPLAGEGDFDAALDVFSSVGYGTEDDDVAIFTTLAAALRPGGRLVVDTQHRDAMAARLARGGRPAERMADGTLLIEMPAFDPIAGRLETVWYWSGPGGAGEKRAALRIYTITELVRLLERAGLRVISAHRGCSVEPFRAEGPDFGGRVALVCER
jgi:SAM-dependent methyltransferase